MIEIIKKYNAEKDHTEDEAVLHMWVVSWISDCVAILRKKYDKEYRDSLKKSNMMDVVRDESMCK